MRLVSDDGSSGMRRTVGAFKRLGRDGHPLLTQDQNPGRRPAGDHERLSRPDRGERAITPEGAKQAE